MRSTKATAAIERLKQRSGNPRYAMVLNANGLFYLTLSSENNLSEKISEPLMLDDFVQFVNNIAPQKAKRISKFDVAFEKQLTQKNNEG